MIGELAKYLYFYQKLDMDEGISSYKGKHIKKNLETKK